MDFVDDPKPLLRTMEMAYIWIKKFEEAKVYHPGVQNASLLGEIGSEWWIKVDGNGKMDAHYINSGFPYTIAESFYAQAGPVHDQEFREQRIMLFSSLCAESNCSI